MKYQSTYLPDFARLLVNASGEGLQASDIAVGVAEVFRRLVDFEREMTLIWRRLNYAVERDSERIPLAESEIRDLRAEISAEKERGEEKHREYWRKHDQLVRKVGKCELRLEDIRKKRRKYAAADIEAAIELDSRMSSLQSEKDMREDLLRVMQGVSEGVVEKYREFIQGMDYELTAFIRMQDARLQRYRDEIEESRRQAEMEFSHTKDDIEKEYARWVVDSDSRVEALRNECAEMEKSLKELDKWHPLAEETDVCKEKLREINLQESQLEKEIKGICAEIDSLRGNLQDEVRQSESAFAIRIDDGKREVDRLKEEFDLKEKSGTDGVALKKLSDVIASKRRAIGLLKEECESRSADIKKDFAVKISEVRRKEANFRVKAEQIPLRRQAAETRLRSLQLREKDMAEAENGRRLAIIGNLRLNLDNEMAARAEKRRIREIDLKKADDSFNMKCKELQAKVDVFSRRREEENAERRRAVDGRKRSLSAMESEELKEKGVGPEDMARCRKEIGELDSTLSIGAVQRRMVIEYRKDYEELFSHESEFIADMRRAEEDDAGLRKEYEENRIKREATLTYMNACLLEKGESLKIMKEGLRSYHRFYREENIIPDSFLMDDETETTDASCLELVGRMRGAIMSMRRLQSELKNAVNRFCSCFRPDPQSRFSHPQSDADYLAFAGSLRDYIDSTSASR